MKRSHIQQKSIKISFGQLRSLIRESLIQNLLREERIVFNNAEGAEKYRVLTLRTKKELKYDGRIAIVDINADNMESIRAIQNQLDDVQWYTDSLVVDVNKKLIDLDATDWLQELDRRRGKGNSSKSYIIPNAASQHSNILKFQKVVKSLMNFDKRVDGTFNIVGNPKYEGMSVSDVLATGDELEPMLNSGKYKPITMYHGTSQTRWNRIKEKGLNPGNAPFVYVNLVEDYSEHNVYLTTSVAVAENYATRAAIDDKSLAIVLKVTVLDPTKFVTDEDNMNWMWVTSPGEPWSETPKGEEVEIHFKHKLWRQWPNASQIIAKYQTNLIKTLRKSGTVAYKGRIPVNNVELYATYKPASMGKDPGIGEYQDARERTFDTYKKSTPKQDKPIKTKTQDQTSTKQTQEPQSGEKSYKIYGKKGSAPLHTRLKGKPFGPASGKTKFKSGDSAHVSLDGNKLRVKSTDGSNTQLWDELE